MDERRPLEPDTGGAPPAADEAHPDRPLAIGGDERRMHVRAYNFWASRLGSRSYPSIDDLEPGAAADFGRHAVLLDFSRGVENPAIAFLGDVLRAECGAEGDIRSLADVPSRSLLSRLTDHYLQIVANRAPIGFEAEFMGQRGRVMLYRGILMPFSSDDEAIDYVYGVINWKELAEPQLATALAIEVERAVGAPPRATIWAQGPEGGLDQDMIPAGAGGPDASASGDPSIADRLVAARARAEQLNETWLESRAALHHALGEAYDLGAMAERHPEDYAALLADARIEPDGDAPMTALVRLVFGERLEPAHADEFAAALGHARRLALPAGRFADHIGAQRGGLKALAAAERQLRGAAARADAPLVLALARRGEDGHLTVIEPVPDDGAMLGEALRRITGAQPAGGLVGA